jgi:hypothetical protein
MRTFLIWFLLSLMVGVIANGKGRSALMFFCLSMLFSPAVGFLSVLLASPSHEMQRARGLKSGALKKCPSCAETVNADDTVCRFCGRPLPEIIEVDATIENGP